MARTTTSPIAVALKNKDILSRHSAIWLLETAIDEAGLTEGQKDSASDLATGGVIDHLPKLCNDIDDLTCFMASAVREVIDVTIEHVKNPEALGLHELNRAFEDIAAKARPDAVALLEAHVAHVEAAA